MAMETLLIHAPPLNALVVGLEASNNRVEAQAKGGALIAQGTFLQTQSGSPTDGSTIRVPMTVRQPTIGMGFHA